MIERKHKCSGNIDGTTILFLKVCLFAQLCSTLATYGLQSARLLLPWGFSRQEYWSVLPCPLQVLQDYKCFFYCLCLFFMYYLCENYHKLLNWCNIQPSVLVGCLSNFAGLMKKLEFLNTLLKCNLFIHRGLTVLLKPVDTKVSASPPSPKKLHSCLGFQRKCEILIILGISVLQQTLIMRN